MFHFNKIRSKIHFILFPLSLILLLSCQQRPVEDAIFIGILSDFDTLNELNAADSDALQVIQHMLFTTLTRLDENLEFQPYLAENWAFSEDGKILTYSLRDDIRWSDGQPTTAWDVQYTWQLAIDTAVAYPAASRFDLVDSVVVENLHVVRFHFKKAYADALFDTQIPILPKHVLAKIPAAEIATAAFNRNPVSNGPFRLASWKANDVVTFLANPEFPIHKPKTKQVSFVVIPNENSLLNHLKTGEIDVVSSLSPQIYQSLQSEKNIVTQRYDGREFAFVGWNNSHPVLQKNVRLALSKAVDRREIIATLLNGFAEPATGPLMPFAWAYDATLAAIPFDPAAARTELDAAGWRDSDGDGIREKDGQLLTFTISVNAGNQLRSDIAVMLQAQLRNVGADAQIETLEWHLFIEKVFVQSDFDAVVLSWDADFSVNPAPLWHSDAIENGYNFVKYRNPAVDSLLESGRNLADRNASKPIWRKFQQTIINDAPYTFLFIPSQLAAMDNHIQNAQMDARGFLCNIAKWEKSITRE
ncbi:MAG: hypothetical protein KDH95_15750 [Calditrichaeota bacterium]|nr:hypothetical protein [Calditrichota bacterium]